MKNRCGNQQQYGKSGRGKPVGGAAGRKRIYDSFPLLRDRRVLDIFSL